MKSWKLYNERLTVSKLASGSKRGNREHTTSIHKRCSIAQEVCDGELCAMYKSKYLPLGISAISLNCSDMFERRVDSCIRYATPGEEAACGKQAWQVLQNEDSRVERVRWV